MLGDCLWSWENNLDFPLLFLRNKGQNNAEKDMFFRCVPNEPVEKRVLPCYNLHPVIFGRRTLWNGFSFVSPTFAERYLSLLGCLFYERQSPIIWV